MAKKNYDQLSKDIVKYIGGEENVISLFHCATRLRFKVKDEAGVDKKRLEQLKGVITVINSGGQMQVVIGNDVADVYEAIFANTGLKPENKENDNKRQEKKNLLNTFMETISGIFAPVLGAMSGAGMLKALLILCTTCGLLTADMGTYRILYAAADGVFTFIPMFLAITAARKFKANEFVSLGIAAALVYPDMTAAFSAGEALSFLKIPVVLVSYTSSVIPIVISIYVLSKLEKGLKKVVPSVCKTFLTPMLSLMIMVPATYLVIGPISDTAGKLLASGYTALVGFNPMIAGGILGLIWPAAVMFGLHWGFVPIVMNNIAEYGRDTLFVITGPNNMAQAGATLGVFLKTKNKEIKELAGPAALSAVLAGITEPAIYGVTLRFKRPFFIGAVFSGIAGAIVTYLFGYSDDMLPNDNEEEQENKTEKIVEKDVEIKAPVNGKAIALSEVKDEVFAGGALGKGAAIIPEDGRICAPCDGVVSLVYPTGHAIGIQSENGAELLIHIGMDTVTLEGKCFDIKVKQGQEIKAGELLIEADLEGIQSAGLDITTPIVVTNIDDYVDITAKNMGNIKAGDRLLYCISK